MKRELLKLITILIILLGIGIFNNLDYMNTQTIEITPINKYAIEKGYYVTTDEEVFKVKDLFFKGKFNSADIYNAIQIGGSYQVEVSGVRIPFFSMFRNINKVKAIGV